MTVRDATPDDAPAMARVHVAAWQAAYRGVMPDEFLDSLRVDERESMWRRSLAVDDPRVATLVVENADGAIAGFANTGPARGSGDDRSLGELFVINLDPASWGQGLGPALLAESTRRLAAAGFDRAILWVVVENARARRFYEREGWSHSGDDHTRSDRVLSVTVTEARYERSLTGAR